MSHLNNDQQVEFQTEATRFLELLGKDPDKTWIRCLRQHEEQTGTGADTQHLKLKANASAFFVTGNGDPANGRNLEDSDITSCPALFVEWDDGASIEEQLQRWQALELPEPSVMVATGGRSVHCYWVLQEPISAAEWKRITARLIAHCNSDKQCSNPSRVMRLPGSVYYDKKTGKATGQCRILSSAGTRYRAAEVEACLPAPKPAKPVAAPLSRDWEPRSVDEINAAAAYIPARIVGGGTYEESRNALCGCSAALAQAGVDDPDDAALELLGHLWADAGTGKARQVLDSCTTRNAASFWAIARDNGYELSRFDHQKRNSKKDHLPKTFSELKSQILKMTIAGREDEAMELRAEMKGRFHVNDSHIESKLFKLHTKLETESRVIIPPESLDLSQISGLEWLIEGFVPDNDITLIWGAAGDGKTTAALAASRALLLGTGLLDHPKPTEKGAVLFIASDSGAPPLIAAMQQIGMTELPEITEGQNKQFHLWASDQNQGMTAWAADLRGCVKLLEFVKQKQIKLVVIDSCKAVCSGADLDYTNNQLVTSLLTYFKEVICPHAAVIFLNHDGTGKGASAGAKAWKEIPSIVHCISREKEPDGIEINSRRQWTVTKSRVGAERRFHYQLNNGLIELCPNQEVIGNCLDQVIETLTNAWKNNGVEIMKKQEIISILCKRGGPSKKTVENTLSNAIGKRSSQICRAGYGKYKLAPSVLDLLKSVHTNQEELPEKVVISEVLVCSRELPSGSLSSSTRSHYKAEKFPMEIDGNTPYPYCGSQSEEILPDGCVKPWDLMPAYKKFSDAEIMTIQHQTSEFWAI